MASFFTKGCQAGVILDHFISVSMLFNLEILFGLLALFGIDIHQFFAPMAVPRSCADGIGP